MHLYKFELVLILAVLLRGCIGIDIFIAGNFLQY